MNKDRPTFYTEENKPIRAAGILCYVHDKDKDQKLWLFRKQNNLFSDTGGKTETIDNSAIDTAIRETVEETNGHLFSQKHNIDTCHKILCREINNQKVKKIYVENCKYLLILFKLRFKNYKLPLERFGNLEKHDNQIHSYHWLEEIPSKDLHPRLHGAKKQLNF